MNNKETVGVQPQFCFLFFSPKEKIMLINFKYSLWIPINVPHNLKIVFMNCTVRSASSSVIKKYE